MAIYDEKAVWGGTLSWLQEEISLERDNWSEFMYRINTKRFIVKTCNDDFQKDDPTGLLVSRWIRLSCDPDNNDPRAADDAMEALEEVIYEAGWLKFPALAPAIDEESTPPPSLYSELHPETYYLRLISDEGKAKLVFETYVARSYSTNYGTIKLTSDLPRYEAREIQFEKKLYGHGFIAKVSVNGQDMCCKMLHRDYDKSVLREYECLVKIAAYEHAASMLLPKLVGLVVEGGEEKVVGILEEYIPHTTSLGRLIKDDEGIETIENARRTKWAMQIKGSIAMLHDMGVVWGDGKPHNVLIDSETDSCWLVDFGGGWTPDWVDEKLKETKEGDEQALKKIIDFLAV